MVGLEQREIEVDDDAGRLEQLDLGPGELRTLRASGVGRPAAAWASPRAMTYSGSGRTSAARSNSAIAVVEVARADRQPAQPGQRRGVVGTRSRARLVGSGASRRGSPVVDEQVAEERL